MRHKFIATTMLAGSTLIAAAAPAIATAQPHRHRVEVCETSRGARNTGTVVGAVTGGLLGNTLSHGGGKTGGTILGAGVGAVAGHQIAKHNAKRHCHWEWRND